MRVLRAMMVLLPMLAFAGWRQVGTLSPTTAGDVQVVDAGVVLAVSSNTASVWHVSDAGVVTPVNTFISTGMASAASFGSGCIIGVTTTGNIVVSPGCGTTSSLGALSGRVIRLLTPQLGVAVVSNASFDLVYGGPGPAPGWAAMGGSLLNSGGRTLQVSRIGGIDYAVANGGNGVRVSVDGGVPTGVVVGTNGLRDAAPFPLAGAPAIFGATATALVLVRDYRVPTAFSPAMPAGLAPRYVGMGSVTGMVTTLSGVVLSPIPDPNRVAEVWKVRPGPASEWLTEKIHCVDDRYCATMTDAGVVYLYENAVAPGVVVAPVSVDAGQTIRLVADAGDGDGDPVFVSWTSGTGGLSAVAGVDDGTQVDFTAPATCSPISIDVTVSDGLPEHDRTIMVPITVNARGDVQLGASTVRPLAGGQPVAFVAGVDGGCGSTATLTWSSTDGQSGAGGTFDWVPPQTECNADGGQVTITSTATWSSGAPSTTSLSQVVVVQPWGRPATPAFSSPAMLASNTSATWLSSGAEHACSLSNGFPGTELIWSSISNSGGAGLVFVDGGVQITAPFTCVPLQVSLTARRQVFGEDAGRVSDAGLLVVDIIPETATPLPPTTGFSISVGGDAGHVFGVVKADAGCAEQRGVVAMVTVYSGGAFVTDGGFSPLDGGEWDLQVPGGCSGGRYDVVAELYEGARPTGAVAQGFVDLTFSVARVGTLSVDRLDVTCGEGAKTPLVLLPAAGACGAAEITWRATAGPALVTMSGSGETIDLQTAALDFSSVGQQIALEFVADAGAGNLDVATRTIDLGVQPFLEVSVKANPALRREEEAVSLEVTLRNTTACSVDGLSVTLPFSGGSPILDSVLLDGVRVAARVTDQGVVVDGVSVPADGVAKLQLSARARLLSTPTVEPFASLGGFVVSTLTPKASPATGCGCSELASPAVLALALLVLRRRRRAAG